MATNEFSTFPKAPGLEPHYQIILSHNKDIGCEKGFSAKMKSVYSTYPESIVLNSNSWNNKKTINNNIETISLGANKKKALGSLEMLPTN